MADTITIGITTHNRLHILKKMALSLYKSDLSISHNIRIYDDCSTEFGTDELRKLFPTAASIIINEYNVKADRNTFQMYKAFLDTSDTYLFNADSDLIFRENWLKTTLELAERTSGVLTVFNAYSHESYVDVDNDLCLKKVIGFAGTFLRRDRVEELVNYINSRETSNALDWRFSEFFNRKNIPIYCVKNSLVQHIGYTGQNSFFHFDFGKEFHVENAGQGQIINDILENFVNELEHLERKRMDNLSYHLFRICVILSKKVLPQKLYEFIRHKLKK